MPKPPRRLEIAALAWGFVEAMVFFIVPDVLLSVAASASAKRAYAACLYATAGALLGGAMLWQLGDAIDWRALFQGLPAVDASMVAAARERLASDGPVALFAGILTGTPYKIFVIEARDLGIGLGLFLAVSVPARLGRFLLVTAAAHAFCRVTRRRLPESRQRLFLLGSWVVFYAAFFSLMP